MLQHLLGSATVFAISAVRSHIHKSLCATFAVIVQRVQAHVLFQVMCNMQLTLADY
jgi:hypothetical protein